MGLDRNPPPDRKPAYEYEKSAGIVYLYLDDLESVVRLLSRSSSEVVIGAGQATAGEPADLRSATSAELQQLTLRTERPAVVITLSPGRAMVSSHEDSDEARSLVNSATAVLRNIGGGEVRAWFRSQIPSLLGWFFVATGVWQFYAIPGIGGIVIGILSIALGLLIAIGAGVTSWRDANRSGRAYVNLKSRADAKSARSSNQALFGSAIVGAIIGAGVTLLGTWIASILGGN